MKKRLLWIGDACCPSGFGLATHKILETLHVGYDVTVLGMNYRGDPHAYPYPVYAAGAEGDAFGVSRLMWMCHKVEPDVIVVQNDGWNVPFYTRVLRHKKPNGEYLFPQFATVPVVAIVAIDGQNFRGEWLDDISMAIFWTEFALNEARLGGYDGPAAVIPLGVDLAQYFPVDRRKARIRKGIPPQL